MGKQKARLGKFVLIITFIFMFSLIVHAVQAFAGYSHMLLQFTGNHKIVEILDL